MANRREPPSEQLDKIRSDMTGGLNLTASSLKTPLTDTPLQRNVKINIGGRVRTRPGTRILFSSPVSLIDIFAFNFSAIQNYIILKVGRDLLVGTISPSNVLTITQTFTNTWGVAASLIPVQSTLVNDGTSRLVITSGIEVPKEVRFNAGTSLFTVNNFSATGQPSQWTGTNWPRSVAVWDGRLWFGGTPGQPNVIWSSKSGDFTNFTPGDAAADGFVVSLQSSEDVTIQRLESFRSSLVSFGRRAILAIQPATFASGSSVAGGVVTPTNYRVTTISTNGCVSGRTVLRVDKTLHYLSDVGVFELTETGDSTQPYAPALISQKLIELFENAPGSVLSNSCAGYSSDQGEYWVTLPETSVKKTDTPTDLKSIYVYKLANKEWTVYDHDSLRAKSSIRTIKEFLDSSGNTKMVTSTWVDGISHVLLHGDEKRSDFLTQSIGNGTNTTFVFPIQNALRPTQTIRER
jgi:hypothetical protein